MADVFVSYKKEDRKLAEAVVAALRAGGFSVWWDEDLTPRTTWDAEIEREIRATKAVLVLWTPRSVAENSFVRNEADFGKEHKKLVPVRLEPCELPLSFRRIQTADLTNWDRRDRFDPNWIRALTWIEQLVHGRPPANGEQFIDRGPAGPQSDRVQRRNEDYYGGKASPWQRMGYLALSGGGVFYLWDGLNRGPSNLGDWIWIALTAGVAVVSLIFAVTGSKSY